MKKASEKDIERLRKMSAEIDHLYGSGKQEEGAELLRKAVVESENVDKAYHLFFLGEQVGYAGDNKKQEQLFRKARKLRQNDFFICRNLGAVLSIQGEIDSAIEMFEKVLELNPKDYDAWRDKGVALSEKGELDSAIEMFEKALELNPKDHNAWREKGVSLSKKGEIDSAIEMFEKALELNPKDHNAWRQKGVSLSKKGEQDRAIEMFEKVLELNPKDYHAWRQKGVSLSKKGEQDGAIEMYEKALELNPKDYHAWRNKGVSLSKKGEQDSAIEMFEKALELNPKDHDAWREKGVVLWEKGQTDEALSLINHALEIAPGDENSLDWKRYIAKQVQQDEEATPVEVDDGEGVPEILAVINQVRETMKDEIDGFLEQMVQTEKKRSDFFRPGTRLDKNGTVFLVLRKWNSYTPIIPTDSSDRYVGGGYFLWDKGVGTVIDPGYNFIENFYRAGGKIFDIHNIVLTHAHNDHTIDFESLLALVYRYNKQNGLKPDDKGYKTVSIYCNIGSFQKFSGLLDLRGADYIRDFKVLMAGHSFDLTNGLTMHSLKANHDELLTKKYATGLLFDFTRKGGRGVKRRTILITSDTGLYPQTKKGGEIMADTTCKEIWEEYPLPDQVDLLIPHLGSIREEEFKADPNKKLDEIFYPNHLGMIGAVRLITAIRPKLAVISEMGEELREFQKPLMKMFNKIIKGFYANSNGHVPSVLPGDLPFIYDVWEHKVHCIFCKKMVDANSAAYGLHGSHFFYYDKSLMEESLDEIGRYAQEFKDELQSRQGLYFDKN